MVPNRSNRVPDRLVGVTLRLDRNARHQSAGLQLIKFSRTSGSTGASASSAVAAASATDDPMAPALRSSQAEQRLAVYNTFNFQMPSGLPLEAPGLPYRGCEPMARRDF